MSLRDFERHAQLAARIFDTPLAMDPRKLQAILCTSAIAERFSLDVDAVQLETPVAGDLALGEPRRYQAEQDAPPYTVQDGVAVIDMMGSLVQRSSWMTAASGLCSYDKLGAAFDAALADKSVRAIVLRCDSPGGEVAGMFEMADAIYEARGQKPVYAVAEDMSASAAYLIAAACEKVYTPQAGILGSIGIISAHVDTSERDKGRGVKITHFHAGARKLDGVKPLNDDSATAYQARVDALYNTMTAKVALYRGISQDDAKATEAGVFVGSQAVDVGLADAVQSVPKTLSALGRRTFQVPAARVTTSAALPAPVAALPPLPPKEKPMPPIDPTVPAVDPKDAELAELRAKNQVFELSAAREKNAKRDAVLEKHAKRLSPATMAAMKDSLAPIADAAKVDEILAKLADETTPAPQGVHADPVGPATVAAAAAPRKKYEDAQGEAIRRARELRKGKPEMNTSAALQTVFRDDKDLLEQVNAQRASEDLPLGPPADIKPFNPARR